MDRARIGGIQTNSSNHLAVCLIVSHFDQGCDVGVVCFVHAVSMARNRGEWGTWWTVPQLSHLKRELLHHPRLPDRLPWNHAQLEYQAPNLHHHKS